MPDRTRCNCGCNKKLSRKNLLRHSRGEGLHHIKAQYTQRRDLIPPAGPNPRPRSPGDVDGPPRKRQRVSEAQSLREIHRPSCAANIAGPSTSPEVVDPRINTTANFEDVDMLSESFEDSDPESSDSDCNNMPKSQSKGDSLSTCRVNDEDKEDANRSMVTFNTDHTSRGGTVNNITGDYVINYNINLVPGSTPPEVMNQIFRHDHVTSRTRSRSVAQLRYPSQPHSDQLIKICPVVDPFYNSASDSVKEVRVMISIVQTMMANPMLCVSKDLPETLTSLKRLLTLMELALRAYQHTDLVHSLSSAISIGVEDCRRLLDDLITHLTDSRHVLSNAVLYSIRKYMWTKIRWRDSAIRTLETKLRKSHSSFAACLLALGRAAWPELERGQKQETLEELAKFYVELEQESTSLRHIHVDAVIVQDHLGRDLHVPMIFCTSSQDFHAVITGFCRGLAGDGLIRQGNYRILNSEDDEFINPEEFAMVFQPGMALGMSIVFHEKADERQGNEGYSCPRCQHVNSRCTGWVTCANCNGSFKISPEEGSIVSPETERHAGAESIPDEMHLFRKILVFSVAARIDDRELLREDGQRDSQASALPNVPPMSPQQGTSQHKFISERDPSPGRSIPDIIVDPPTNPHAPEMQLSQGLYPDGSPFIQGHTSTSTPQEYQTFSGSSTSHVANWGSPASSESAFSNPSRKAHGYADFNDNTSDRGADNHTSPSNELFDFDEYLNLSTLPDVPQWRSSQDEFISGRYSYSPAVSSVSYGSPYSRNSLSPRSQRSPTHDEASSPVSGFATDGQEMTLPPHPSQRPVAHRPSLSGDGLLLPLPPTALRMHHSGGSTSPRGHRYTTSDAQSITGHYFDPTPTLASHTDSHRGSQGSGGSDQFLGVDLHGSISYRGLQRAQRRAGTPYERPEAHFNDLGAVSLDIPTFIMASVSELKTHDNVVDS